MRLAHIATELARDRGEAVTATAAAISAAAAAFSRPPWRRVQRPRPQDNLTRLLT
jgi:hypothetical protein